MEFETLVEDVVDRPAARAARPAVKAPGSQLSAIEEGAGAVGGVSPALGPAVVIGLQRTAGNAAVTALIRRSVALAEEEEEDQSASVRDVVGRGRGEPMDPTLKDEMEARLGADLSDVRIHRDAEAARSAAAVSARAYTVHNEVVLGAESPSIDSAEGKRMLAHELTHVIQQRQGPVSGTPIQGGISISEPSDAFEQAAEANADRAMSADMPRPGQHSGDETAHDAPAPPVSLQRGPADTDTLDEEEEQEEAAPVEEAEMEAPEAEAEAAAPVEEAEAEMEAPEAGAEAEMEAPEAEAEAAAPLEEAEAPTAAEYQQEAGEAEEAAEQQEELVEAGEEEATEEASEEAASEFEVEEDQLGQEEAEIERAEEEEEEAVV